MARRIDAELYAVHVDARQDRSAEDQKTLEANIQFAESLGATVARLKGTNVADSVAAFTRDKHITQVIFGRSAVDGWRKWLYMTAMNRFLRGAPAVDVHIVTQELD
jgi:two-component system sensor histidine kinase KdpD